MALSVGLVLLGLAVVIIAVLNGIEGVMDGRSVSSGLKLVQQAYMRVRAVFGAGSKGSSTVGRVVQQRLYNDADSVGALTQVDANVRHHRVHQQP